jgi:hypothetical protein
LRGANVREAVLIRPASSYRLLRSTWTDTPIPPDEPLAANPPAGAVIEYYLPRDERGPVMLEVLDGKGELVRRYRSDDPLEPTPEELSRELIPRYWIREPRALPAAAGMHRWVWDLHYPAPVATARGYPISAVPHATPRGPEGPVALPGTYLVRLTVGGHRLEAPLVLTEDPRVKLAAAALEDQFHLATKLADLLSSASSTLLAARSVRQQIAALAPRGAAAQPVRSYDKRLSELLEPAKDGPEAPAPTATARLTLTEVQDHINTLYAEVIRADAAPTTAQRAACEAAAAALADLLSAWRQLQSELPTLNSGLRELKLAEIRPELPAARDPNVADEN